MQRSVILASKSPRRQELLQTIFPHFSVQPAYIVEEIPPYITIGEAAQYLADRKAAAVAARHPESLVIGADTLVIANGHILGKPDNEKIAAQMLSLLSGQTHEVRTGVAVYCGGKAHAFTCVTEVEFYPLTPTEIEAYVAGGEPMDKAGAYAVQGDGSLFVRRICGDYFNVVGLPVSMLYHRLAEWGYL